MQATSSWPSRAVAKRAVRASQLDLELTLKTLTLALALALALTPNLALTLDLTRCVRRSST